MNSDDNPPPIDPEVRIGHVHLKVSDLERSLRFYCGVLGFQLTQRYATQAAFVSAGGYHHHIGLNTWESLGGSPPPPGTTGLYHVAILCLGSSRLGRPRPHAKTACFPGHSPSLAPRRPEKCSDNLTRI
jgi:catechol-2,3-dioxygenase